MSILRRTVSTSARRMSAEHSFEEGAAAVGKWKYVSAACVAVIAIKFITVFSGHHEAAATPHLEYTYIRHKPFPWGDGDTSLFSGKHH